MDGSRNFETKRAKERNRQALYVKGRRSLNR
jgi:hypothetical protein